MAEKSTRVYRQYTANKFSPQKEAAAAMAREGRNKNHFRSSPRAFVSSNTEAAETRATTRFSARGNERLKRITAARNSTSTAPDTTRLIMLETSLSGRLSLPKDFPKFYRALTAP